MIHRSWEGVAQILCQYKLNRGIFTDEYLKKGDIHIHRNKIKGWWYEMGSVIVRWRGCLFEVEDEFTGRQ